MTQQTIDIGGMTCGHCLKRVRAALAALPGVTIDTMRVGQATVSFDESTIDGDAIARAIADAGYDVLQTR
jgi:copper chaperone CopZ